MTHDKKAYRPRWQEHPGYKTLVDEKSEKGILPEQTEDGNMSDGQGNMDVMWPIQLSQTREKERALPLPSNFDKKRDKRIGPTYVNKPRKSPDRTLPERGQEYGHPTKWDYNYVRRRKDVTTADEEEETWDEGEVESAIDNLLESVGAVNPFPTPSERQRNQGGNAKRYDAQYYAQHPGILQKEKIEWETRKKHDPGLRRHKRMYDKNRSKYERRGLGFTEPAERTREWREERKRSPENQRKKRNREQTREQEERWEQNRQAGMEALADALEILGIDMTGGDWPLNWNTHVKKTKPPGELQRNFDPENDSDTGVPRKDPQKQEGQPLRAPDLDEHHQPGLFTQHEPPGAGAINTPTTNNPTDGSGKVLPMSYYTDITQNTQSIPDGRQDRYLHNNNFEVKQGHFGVGVRSTFGIAKQAFTLDEILKRCDKKIKIRSKERVPKLARIDTKNWIWHWDVGDHKVRVQAFKRGRAQNLRKLNLKVSCSCPFWRWWGPAHWGTKSDYQKGAPPGTAAYPKIRDPARWRPVCKHAYAVLEKSRKFFVRPEKSPLRKLGTRFFVDSSEEIEIEPLDLPRKAHVAHVAQRYLEREIIRRVVARYLALNPPDHS